MSSHGGDRPLRYEGQVYLQTPSRPGTSGNGQRVFSRDGAQRFVSSAPSTPSSVSNMSDNSRHGRLEQLLNSERKKESLFARLKVKFIRPNMDPSLQEAISRAIDEMSSLPYVSAPELGRLQKRIQNIEYEFRKKTHGLSVSRPSTGQSRSISTPKSFEQSRPQSSWNSMGSGEQPKAEIWVMGSYGDADAHMAEILKERDRLTMQKRQTNSNLVQMSKEKYDKFQGQYNHEEEEASKFTTTGDINLIDEDIEDIDTMIKKKLDNTARINEMVYKAGNRATDRYIERKEQEEFVEAAQDDLNRTREMRVLDARKRNDELRRGLVSNEQRFNVRKEATIQGLRSDQEMLEKFAENYDRNLHEKEFFDQYAKDWRYARATAVTEPYIKSANERAHEDELKASQDRQTHEERLKREELRRIQKILNDREETKKSVEHILKTKEERRRQQMQLCDQQAEYWRSETENLLLIDGVKCAQYTDANREHSKKLQEQSMRGDVMGRRSEPSYLQPQPESSSRPATREQRSAHRANSAGPVRQSLVYY